MISTHSKIKVINGCKALDILKGQVGRVISVEELGKDYGYSVKVVIRFDIMGKDRVLYARHINRLSDGYTNLNNGDPTKKISIQVVK